MRQGEKQLALRDMYERDRLQAGGLVLGPSSKMSKSHLSEKQLVIHP